MYRVIWVAGERDGEELARFEKEIDATNFAIVFEAEHEEEFDPGCGGVAIIGPDGNEVINWG